MNNQPSLEEKKRSSQFWNLVQMFTNKTMVYDPDGWDRKNFDESWNESISPEEFEKRSMFSTQMPISKTEFISELDKIISQAKAQGAEEERKSCLKAFKADKYKRSDVQKTTKDLKTNKEFLRGYLSAQSDLQESKTQYMVSLTPQKEEKV